MIAPVFSLLIAMLIMVAGCAPTDRDSRTSRTLNQGSLREQTTPQPKESSSVSIDLGGDSLDDAWFEQIRGEKQLEFTYRSGRHSGLYYILEGMGGGVAMIDFDTDGDLDLFFTGGGSISAPPGGIQGLPSALFRNDGNWQFLNVTEKSGLSQPGNYSHGCAVVDFNQDGSPDLVVCGYGGCRLYLNQQDATFREVTHDAHLHSDGWNIAAASGDFDQDGWPDLLIVRYLNWTPNIDRKWHNDLGQREVAGPTFYDGVQSKLLRNQGDGTFEDITHFAGLREVGKGLGAVVADLNRDGWLDIYVANDEMAKYLYLGRDEFPFQEVGMEVGVATDELGNPEGSMGLDVGDYDGDGELDLWVTNFRGEDNGLYRNLGDGSFLRTTAAVGLAGVSRPFVGWSTALADFDSDGWLDAFVANGHVSYNDPQSALQQPAQLFRNVKGKRFENVSLQGGSYFRAKHIGRGAAFGDLDNDGALDIVVSHLDEPVTLLKNRRPPKDFVRVSLRATGGDRDAIGALAVMTLAGRRVTKCVRSGAGYGSHSDQRITFPVFATDSLDVTVCWPGRGTEIYRDLKKGATSVLVEGEGERANGTLSR
jgi:hypothetical protein